jgi:hypothetical protein
MTVTAATDSTDVVPAHEHDWRLVQVDYTDGVCVREFACDGCAGVWFA